MTLTDLLTSNIGFNMVDVEVQAMALKRVEACETCPNKAAFANDSYVCLAMQCGCPLLNVVVNPNRKSDCRLGRWLK